MCPDDEIYSPIGLIECINHLEKSNFLLLDRSSFGFREEIRIVFQRCIKLIPQN